MAVKMCLVKADICKDAFKYFAPLRYLGLSVRSVAKQGQPMRIAIAKTNIFIVLTVSLLIAAVTLTGCHFFCTYKINYAANMTVYVILNAEVMCAVINTHVHSEKMVRIFEELIKVDEKLLKLTECDSLIMEKRKHSYFAFLLRYGLFTCGIVFDLVLVCNDMGRLPLQLTFCALTPHFCGVLRSHASVLYVFFICECTARVKYVNHALESMLLMKERIPCIEASIAPRADICYKMDEAKFVVSQLLNIVTKINKIFQFVVLLKVMHIFGMTLAVAYFAADVYLFNKSISSAKTFVYSLYLAGHFAILLQDLLIDIWIYKQLHMQVNLANCEIFTRSLPNLCLQIELTTDFFDKAYRSLHSFSMSEKQVFSSVVNFNLLSIYYLFLGTNALLKFAFERFDVQSVRNFRFRLGFDIFRKLC